MSEGVLSVVAIAALVAVWFWQGDPPRDIRFALGHPTLEDQRSALETYMSKHRQGSGGDVWLVKGNLGTADRVAVFFGYLDDWDTCFEFASMYMQRYPADDYSCQYAN